MYNMSNEMCAVEKAVRNDRSVAWNTSSFPLRTRYSRDGKENVTVPGTTASLNNNNSDVTLHNKSECHYSWSALCTEDVPAAAPLRRTCIIDLRSPRPHHLFIRPRCNVHISQTRG